MWIGGCYTWIGESYAWILVSIIHGLMLNMDW